MIEYEYLWIGLIALTILGIIFINQNKILKDPKYLKYRKFFYLYLLLINIFFILWFLELRVKKTDYAGKHWLIIALILLFPFSILIQTKKPIEFILNSKIRKKKWRKLIKIVYVLFILMLCWILLNFLTLPNKTNLEEKIDNHLKIAGFFDLNVNVKLSQVFLERILLFEPMWKGYTHIVIENESESLYGVLMISKHIEELQINIFSKSGGYRYYWRKDQYSEERILKQIYKLDSEGRKTELKKMWRIDPKTKKKELIEDNK